MSMILQNNRDIHLAQEWILQLHCLIRQTGYSGFDPFDIKAHPWLRSLQNKPLLRKASTVACDAFPHGIRALLRTPRSLNPKTPALAALGHLRLFQCTEDRVHLENGLACIGMLEQSARATPSGMGWGYPFPFGGTGVEVPAHVPVTVVCTIAGDAFLLAHEVTRNQRFLDTAAQIARFLLHDLPRISSGAKGWCFAYALGDSRRVHNANLLAVEYLVRTGTLLGEASFVEEALPALDFSLAAQREDGAWPYGACEKQDPFEPSLMAMVDNHHTGFVLRSLHGINAVLGRADIDLALQKGFGFYSTLFSAEGRPTNGEKTWPVDIHACAEGILCPSVLADCAKDALTFALRVMRWTHYHMRDSVSGAPWYRIYPGFTSRIAYPRWGVAWMYRALAEYLYAARTSPPPLFHL